MAWPTSYKSSYRPQSGSLGWSTRHLIAEQTDSIIELTDRKLRARGNDHFGGYLDSGFTGRESVWSSTSTVSLHLPRLPDKVEPHTKSPKNDASSQASTNTGSGGSACLKLTETQQSCNADCWLRQDFPTPQKFSYPQCTQLSVFTNATSSLYTRLEPVC